MQPAFHILARLQRLGGLPLRWFAFAAIVAAFAALDEWANLWVNRRFSEVTADALALVLRLLGNAARVQGTTVYSSRCTFEIIGECTAYYPCAIFVAAIVASPAGWRARLAGVLVGVPALLAVNQVRLASLCYVLDRFPAQFETIHVVVWQSLLIFLTLLAWVAWIALSRRPPAATGT